MLLPQEHTVMVRQASKWGQIFLLSLVGLGATAFVTAWFYRLDEVITVTGRLVPQKGGVEVKSPTNGQLEDVLVKNGQQVVEGQTLLRFDVKGPEAKEAALKQQLSLAKKSLTSQLASNLQRQKTSQRNILLTKKILERMKPLVENGAISDLQMLQQENKLESDKDKLNEVISQKEELINKSNGRIVELQGSLNQVQNQLRNELVKAPIGGTVFDLTPDNDQYVVQNAEPLMKIVPKGNLEGRVNIGNKDIGFIKAGLPVKVRVDSFPFTNYGEIDGKISNIGADALPPTETIREYHFPVDIVLQRSNLKTRESKLIPLQAGMTITTNLKLRDRRLIELLSDLFTTRSESLKRLRQP